MNNLWSTSKFGVTNWGIIFGVTCLFLWKYRNNFVFQEETKDGREVVAAIAAYSSTFFGFIGPPTTDNDECRRWSLIGWICPDVWWVKLNSDDSVRGREFRASAGGVLRDFT